MPTLLEKAKKVNSGKEYVDITPEHVSLAVAWAKNEISFGQVKGALESKQSQTAYTILAKALKRAYQEDLFGN